jgi:DNA-binding MarR family transcriptional regulator
MTNDRAYEIAELVAKQCLAGRVRRLNRVLSNLYDRALQPHGIKINQSTVLIYLLVHGDSNPCEIGAYLQMEKSTVSRTIERMKKSGWVEVDGSGPGQTVRVTDLGRQLMVDSHEQWQSAQSKALELLGEDGAISLISMAERVKQVS